jgi:hypothetical protein
VAAHLAPRDERSREQRRLLATVADVRLDPHEELDRHVTVALLAARRIQLAQLLLHLGGDGLPLTLKRLDV